VEVPVPFLQLDEKQVLEKARNLDTESPLLTLSELQTTFRYLVRDSRAQWVDATLDTVMHEMNKRNRDRKFDKFVSIMSDGDRPVGLVSWPRKNKWVWIATTKHHHIPLENGTIIVVKNKAAQHSSMTFLKTMFRACTRRSWKQSLAR
jgi:hypothetical protein